MTLLITIFAAVISTVLWYQDTENIYKMATLCYLFWGASLMWMVDTVAEYLKTGEQLFQPTGAELLNDGFLGLSAVALALVIWIIRFVISDPKGTLKKAFYRRT